MNGTHFDLENRVAQTVKLLNWTQQYPGWWWLICGHENEHMSPKIAQTIIRELAQQSLYELIFVLLEAHKNLEFIKSTRDDLLMNFIISEWKHGRKDGMINKLIDCLE